MIKGRKGRTLAAVGAMLVSAMVVAACSSSSSPSTTSAATGGSAPSSAGSASSSGAGGASAAATGSGGASGAGAAAASSSKFTAVSNVARCPNGPQGTINYVGDIGGPYVRNFNPFSPSANTGAQQALVYESLLQYSLAQSNLVVPWLATKYTWSNGGKTLTFDLRKGVNWSDGQPFTSADVVYTFELLKKDPATNLKGISFSTITANSPEQVTMTFADPEYSQLFYIGTQYIVPKHIWSKISDPSKALNLNPVGTGPYLLTTLTTQSLIMTANPHYWQKDSPCIKTYSAPPYVSNTTADLAMTQGNGDWGGLFVAGGLTRYLHIPGHQAWNPPTNDVALYPNLKKAPLNSLPLRKAISQALDRSKIEQLGELGEETPISNKTGIVLPRDKAQLAAQYQNETFAPDVAKAKATLTAAGYKYDSSGKLIAPNGKPVAFSIIAPAAFSDWIAATQEVVTELKAIGIDATLDAVANAEWVRDMQFGNFDMGINAGELGPNSFYQYDGWMLSSNTAPIGKLATTNFERYSDPKTDALIKSYLATDNVAAQNKAMAGLEGVMVNDLPVIPLYYATDWGLYVTTHLSGWPSKSDPYQIPSGYDTPFNETVLLHLTWKG